MDLDRDLPAEEIAGVEWCSDAFVSLLQELKFLFFLYTGQYCVEKIIIAPKKNPTSLGTATEHVSTFSFPLPSSGVVTFRFLPWNGPLSGRLLSISIDFTPFPVKLISARTRIRMYTCRCISPNGAIL